MQKIIPVILFLLFFLCPSVWLPPPVFSEDGSGESTGSAVLDDLVAVSRFFPRTEGSPGEERTLEYIRKKLTEIGVAYTEEDFSEMESGHSFSRNLIVEMGKRGADRLIVGVPINHLEDAPIRHSGAVNIALALGIVRRFAGESLPLHITVAFLGAEYGEGALYPLGSKQYLTDFFPEERTTVLYLNYRTIPVRTVIRTGADNIISPYWFIDRCSGSMDRAGLYYLVLGNENQIFRLGMSDETTQIRPYLVEEYPSLQLDGRYGTMTQREREVWAGDFIAFFEELINANRDGFPDRWDRHYLFFQARRFTLIIPETEYLIILLVFFSVLLLFGIIFRKRIWKYRIILFRKLWALVILFALIFLFLLLGTLALRGIPAVRGIPLLWRELPVYFLSLKIAAAFSLFFLSSRFLRKVPFPVIRSFYSASALFLLLLNTVLISFFDISFCYYFAWAFFWAFLFSLFPNRYLKLFCLLAAPLWLLKGIYDVFTLPAMEVAEALILSPWRGNLLLAFVILPFALMTVRVAQAFRAAGPERKALSWFFYTSLPAAAAALAVYVFLFDPFTREDPQIYRAIETINYESDDRSLAIISGGPIGTVRIPNEEYAGIEAGKNRSAVAYAETLPEYLEIETETRTFLDRKYIVMTLRLEGNPEKVSLSLHGTEDIILYDANFPFSTFPVRNTAEIHIGRNPPNPLRIEFIIPEERSVEIRLRIRYDRHPRAPVIVPEEGVVNLELILVEWLEV